MHISVSNVHVGITPQIFLSVHCAISGFNTCRPASIEFDYLCCLPRTIIVYEIYLGKELNVSSTFVGGGQAQTHSLLPQKL